MQIMYNGHVLQVEQGREGEKEQCKEEEEEWTATTSRKGVVLFINNIEDTFVEYNGITC